MITKEDKLRKSVIVDRVDRGAKPDPSSLPEKAESSQSKTGRQLPRSSKRVSAFSSRSSSVSGVQLKSIASKLADASQVSYTTNPTRSQKQVPVAQDKTRAKASSVIKLEQPERKPDLGSRSQTRNNLRPEELVTADDEEASTFKVAITSKAKLRPQSSLTNHNSYNTNKLFRKQQRSSIIGPQLEACQAQPEQLNHLKATKSFI